MNPGIFMLLASEKRLEIQRQDQWNQEHNTDNYLLESPNPRLEKWKFILHLISRFQKRCSQTSCEYPHAI